MATIWAKDFMEQCKLLNEKPDAESSLWSVRFNTKYARHYVDNRTGHINTTPMKTSIQYIPHNGLYFFRDTAITHEEPLMNTSIIISEMTSSLTYFMNMLFSGVYQVNSIELVKKNSSSSFGSSSEEQIVKKYY